MTIEEMQNRKRELGFSNEYLSNLTGVPLTTIQKIFSGVTKSPRRKTVEALTKALAAPYEYASLQNRNAYGMPMVKEEPFLYGTAVEERDRSDAAKSPSRSRLPYKKQGDYTLEDYYAIPDDVRAELIDGVLYDMSTPRLTHQMIKDSIFFQLYAFIKKRKGPCRVVTEFAVQIDRDVRTMLTPDIIISCNRDVQKNRCLFGAPDFVAEVLSPSTRQKDLTIKLNKYWSAGVKEVWFVDPSHESVVVYELPDNPIPRVYTFFDSVPVGIWQGKCKVDLSDLVEDIRELIREEEEEKRGKEGLQ